MGPFLEAPMMLRNQRISSRSAIPTRERLASREREHTWQNLRGRRAAHDYHHYTAEPARHFVDILPLPNRINAPPSAGGSATKPHPVAGFGCKVFKYLLGLHETLQAQPGSNLTAARRFQNMAARNSRRHQTLKRGLEQCSPTLKSATFSLSISSLRNSISRELPSD